METVSNRSLKNDGWGNQGEIAQGIRTRRKSVSPPFEFEKGEDAMLKQYLSRKEAAAHLSQRGLVVAKTTLQKFATVGGGPAYSIFGNRALYTVEALDAWAESRLSAARNSTSGAA